MLTWNSFDYRTLKDGRIKSLWLGVTCRVTFSSETNVSVQQIEDLPIVLPLIIHFIIKFIMKKQHICMGKKCHWFIFWLINASLIVYFCQIYVFKIVYCVSQIHIISIHIQIHSLAKDYNVFQILIQIVSANEWFLVPMLVRTFLDSVHLFTESNCNISFFLHVCQHHRWQQQQQKQAFLKSSCLSEHGSSPED